MPPPPPNVAPEFAEATYELEIVEGMATGRNVGTVTATDEDEDDTLSYTLSGDDADSFTITGGGQIRTNAALNASEQDELHGDGNRDRRSRGNG